MKNYIFAFFLLIFSQSLNSQIPGCQVDGAPDLSFFNLSSEGTHPDFTLKIYFNIVRDNNGDGGYDPLRIPNIISQIDGAFNPEGIYFEYVCDDIFYDNTERATFGARNNDWCTWFNVDVNGQSIVPRHSDGIDVFIVTGFNSGNFSGRVSTIPGKFIVLNGGNQSVQDQNSKIEGTTIVHELGHIFGLVHMWHGSTQNPSIWENNFLPDCEDFADVTDCGRDFTCPYSASSLDCVTNQYIFDTNGCAEDSNNGTVAGDYIPDTRPSHAKAENKIADQNCQIDVTSPIYNDPANNPTFPQILDPEGNHYNPDITNYISTTRNKDCRNNYTSNQWTVMKNHIQSHPILSSIHSTKGQFNCDCDFDKIIYLRDDFNWSEIIVSQDIDPLELTDYEIIIESTLTLDVDYTFSGINFTMRADSEINITNGANISIQKDINDVRSVLMACDSHWRGLKVEHGSSLSFTDSDIYETKIAIHAESGSTLNINNIVAFGKGMFSVSNIGIWLEGDVNIENLTNLKIRDFNTGIYCNNASQHYNIDQGEIGDCNVGISLSNAPCRINDFDIVVKNKAINAIYSPGTLIENNYLNADSDGDTHGINMWWCDGSVIKNNTIGTDWQAPNAGISLYLSNGGTIRDMNVIRGGRSGIFAFNTDFSIIQNDIRATLSGNSNRGALTLMLGNGNQILNNYIDAQNVTHGINTIMSSGTQIENNDITTYFGSTYYRPAAIKSEGSNGEKIRNNNVNGTGNSNGILANNTAGNTYDCNHSSVEGQKDALSVLYNSQGQSVKGNYLSASGQDLLIRSIIGQQVHEGNEFCGGNAVAENFNIAENSPFFVNSFYNCHLPPVISHNGWFEDQNWIHNFYTCANDPGPNWMPFWDDEEVLCSYYLRTINTYGYQSLEYIRMIQTMLRYGNQRINFELPKCIKGDPVLSECWKTLVNAEDELIRTSDGLGSERDNLRNKINSLSLSYTSGKEDAYLADHKNEIMALSSSLSNSKSDYDRSLKNVKTILDKIDCTDAISAIAVPILKEYIKFIETEDKSRFDYSTLINFSRLCADDYGPYIHLARGIVFPVSGEHFDQYDTCREGRTKPRSANESVISSAIYPNPSRGIATIDFGTNVTGRLVVLDIAGRKIMEAELNDLERLDIDLSDNLGINLIHIFHSNGSFEILKHISIK
jgi:hypothetical protein